MRALRVSIYMVVAMVGSVANLRAQCDSYDCPPCFSSINPFPGRGPAPDGPAGEP